MSDDLATGTEIAGRYRLIERLPDPCCGQRWSAADTQGGDARLTWLSPPRAIDTALRDKRLSALCRFSHAHAVSSRDAGVFQGAAYLVSAASDGRGLRAWIAELRAQRSPFALRDARTVLDQVAQCLTAAHRGVDGAPITHGATLAESVIIERRGETQFVCRLDDLGLLSLTQAASLTPGARDDGPSVSDDVYGLGALLAEVLTGEAVAPGSDLDAACERFEAARPDAHPSLWKVVRACLAPSPRDRPENIARVRELLRQAVWTPREITLAPEAPPPPPPPPPSPTPAAPERARIVAVSATPSIAAPPPQPSPVLSPPPRPSSPEPVPAASPLSLPVPAPALTPPPVQVSARASLPPLSSPPVAQAEPITLPHAPTERPSKLMQLGVSGLKARLRVPTMEVDTGPRVSAPPPEDEGIQPIEAGATLRVRRSLLEPEATVVTHPLPRPSVVEETRQVDVASLVPEERINPADTFDTMPGARMKTMPPPSRHATYLPLGGPDAKPVAPVAPTRTEPATSPEAPRSNTVAIDTSGLLETPIVTLEDETKRTLRAPRPSTLPPDRLAPQVTHSAPELRASAPPSYAPPTASMPPQAQRVEHAFVDTPTQPGIVAPPPSPAPWTPLPPPIFEAQPTQPEGRALVWGGVAVLVAVLAVLLVAVSSASR